MGLEWALIWGDIVSHVVKLCFQFNSDQFHYKWYGPILSSEAVDMVLLIPWPWVLGEDQEEARGSKAGIHPEMKPAQ